MQETSSKAPDGRRTTPRDRVSTGGWRLNHARDAEGFLPLRSGPLLGREPPAPEKTHVMLRFEAGWVEPAIGANDLGFDDSPEESIGDWHRRHGLWID
ncbi:hypothetical protein BMIN10S_03298 [Bosea minatitlanensis]